MKDKGPKAKPEEANGNTPLEPDGQHLAAGAPPIPSKGHRALSFILIALCFVLFAWGLKFVYQVVTDRTENKGVKGAILTVDFTEGGGSMLIENKTPEGNEITKAMVSFSKDVKVTGPEDRAYSLEELKVGVQVTVVITGDVLETYPVQVKAKRIIIGP